MVSLLGYGERTGGVVKMCSSLLFEGESESQRCYRYTIPVRSINLATNYGELLFLLVCLDMMEGQGLLGL